MGQSFKDLIVGSAQSDYVDIYKLTEKFPEAENLA